MNTEEQIFWTFFISSTIGFVLAVIKMAYKSKCKEINCGCLKIIRDTDTEEKEMEFTRTHPLAPDSDSIRL
jgi:hypothetical protein